MFTTVRHQGDAPKVVLVTAKKENVERDREIIGKFRLSFANAFESGTEAFGYLTSNPCDLILCDTHMSDMDSKSFMRLLKRNEAVKHVPVVMVTEENDRNAVLDAIAAGCAGYILRPYSEETFQRHVSAALKVSSFTEIEEQQIADAKRLLSQGRYDDAIEEFEEILAMQDEAQKYYDMGCRCLVKQKFGQAIVLFNKAIKINELFAEAYHGLAEAYRGKGDNEKYTQYLKQAADTYAQFDRLEEVKELFIEILKEDSAATNPFNTLGVNLRRQDDFEGALRAYTQALELSPSDENIYFNMSKAYYLMGDEENSVEMLTTALSINPGFTEATRLYERLTGKKWPKDFEDMLDNVGRPRESHHDTLVDLE